MARDITNRIAELLSEKDMTQKELAQMSGLTESAISHYIKGDRVPRGINLVKIAKALETSADYLLCQDEISDKENELKIVKTLIARNANQMSKEEKIELMSILIDGE